MSSRDRDFTRAAIVEAEAKIEQARTQVALQVGTLQREIVDAVDWRHWFWRHPAAVLVTLFGLGCLIGAATGGQRAERRR